MSNIISAILSLTVITALLAGLAYSIWENTDDIAFPVIVGIILLMIYRCLLYTSPSPRDRG